jgi:O-antigen ligase
MRPPSRELIPKSMLNKLKNDQVITAPAVAGWRTPALLVLIILMMGSLFVSRAMLSVTMGVFVLVAFGHKAIVWQLRNFFSQPLLWGMSLLFLLPLLSGLWSNDHEQWFAMMRIKLPLLVLPLAFAAPMALSDKQWKIIACTFIFLMTAATIWCLFQYVENSAAINESYLKAKTMRTPLENDRVRFSWLVAVAVLIAAWLCRQRSTKDIYWWILLLITGWLIVFLHLLAVRTGILSFYIILLGWVIHLFWQKKNRVQALGVLATLIVLPFIAYVLLPSFRNRVKYIRYDFDYFKQANYLPGSNDAMRVISIKAGWQVMNENPITGVGFGDVLKETIVQYDKQFPAMLPSDKILPGSEWMMYGSGTGWPGFLLFTFVMAIPFFIKTRHRLLWWLLNATAAFSFLFDIGLEVQFGVFVWAFITLCLGKYTAFENSFLRAASH